MSRRLKSNVLKYQLVVFLENVVISTGKKQERKVREKKAGKKLGENIVRKKSKGKKDRKKYEKYRSCSLRNIHSNVTRRASPGRVGACMRYLKGQKMNLFNPKED
jgi:hypothetical protein